MFTVKVGRVTMSRRYKLNGRVLVSLVLLVSSFLFLLIILLKTRDAGKGETSEVVTQIKKPLKSPAELCPTQKKCPHDQFSFYIQSGAANVVPPKICIQNKLVLGSELKNAGAGINIVIMDGKTGEVTKTDHFNMYSGVVEPLIKLLKDVQTGSAVLIASFDDPSTKLNEEARKLMAELGSSSVQSLGFRDSWGFVGAKGSVVKSNFEKHIKNDQGSNKYINWPELIDLEGCIPKFLE